jgi:Superinfection immunity protein
MNAVEDLLIAVAAIGVYFLPTWIALARRPQLTRSVVIINLFLGWTGAGWIVALAIACTSVPKQQTHPGRRERRAADLRKRGVRGGLEPPAPGVHGHAQAYPRMSAELRERPAAGVSAGTGIHPDTPALVGREVGRRWSR